MEGGEEAVGAGDAAAGDVERGAVVGAGAGEREAEGDVHAGVEGVELEGDETLVVIHAEDAVEVAFDGAEEDGVGREGAGEVGGEAAGDEGANGGGDEVGFFAAEVAVLAGVGVEAGDGDARMGDAALVAVGGEEFSDPDDLGGGEGGGDVGEGDVSSDEGDGEGSAGEAHGVVGGVGAGGEEFGLAGEVEADLVEVVFADGASDDGGEFAVEGAGDGFFKGVEAGLGGGVGRLAGDVAGGAADELDVRTAEREGVGGEGGGDDFRADAGGVTEGDGDVSFQLRVNS